MKGGEMLTYNEELKVIANKNALIMKLELKNRRLVEALETNQKLWVQWMASIERHIKVA